MDYSNVSYMDNRLELTAVNAGNGKKFERIESTVRSTIFYNPATVIGAQSFFSNTGLDVSWQSKEFPNSINAFAFSTIRILDNLQFTIPDPLQYTQALRRFVEGTVLRVSNNGYEVGTYPLTKLVNYKYIAANNATGAAASYTSIQDNFNNEFYLDVPIIVNANELPEFTLIPAPGLTTAIWTAACGPILTGTNNSGLINSTQGFYVSLELGGIKVKPNKG